MLGTEEDGKARSALIEHNLRLVVYIAKKFDNTSVGVEDLISIGTIGLIKAINTFKPDKNIKLATYASRCIENEILMYLRRNNKTKLEVSIDEPLNVDWDGNELLLSDILGTDEDVIYHGIEDEIEKNLLNTAISRLAPRERKIVELRYGLTNDEERTVLRGHVGRRVDERVDARLHQFFAGIGRLAFSMFRIEFQYLIQVPRDGFSLAVLIGSQPYGICFFRFRFQCLYQRFFIFRDFIVRFKVLFNVNTEFFFLQIAYMTIAGKNLIIFSQELLNCFCFCR